MLAQQIKGGASWFKRPLRDGSGWRFWADNDHLHYWLGYHVPVLVILVRPGDGAAFWQVVRPSTVIEHDKGFTMVIPSNQRLEASASEQLLAIAINERGLVESSPRTARSCLLRSGGFWPTRGTPTRCPRPGSPRSSRRAGTTRP